MFNRTYQVAFSNLVRSHLEYLLLKQSNYLAMKILNIINWILISVWGAAMLYALFLPNGSTDAAGQGQESMIKGLGIFVLLIVVGLNMMPYTWSKIIVLIIGLLLMYLIYSIATN